MKRTYPLSLLLALTTLCAAQSPTAPAKSTSADSAAKANPQVASVSAKPSPATVKVVPVAGQKTAAVQVKAATVPVQPASAKPVAVSAATTSARTVSAQANKAAPAKATSGPTVSAPTVTAKPVVASKSQAKTPTAAEAKDPFTSHAKSQTVQVKTVSAAQAKPAAQTSNAGDGPVVIRKVGAAGRRDPFVSPVVSIGVVGSGCSSGKRCLDIEQIALRGVVKSETGMIAVVVNALDKAYFLRENDPVFNGFVEKITGDSIVFKQTFHDKLGKPLTRDVTKTITRPAV